MSLYESMKKLNKRCVLYRALPLVVIGVFMILNIKMGIDSEIFVGKKEENKFVYNLDEKKYADYSFCNKRENISNWKDLYFESSTNKSEESFLPKNLEEDPVEMKLYIPKEFLREEVDFCLERPKLKAMAIVHSAIKNVDRRSITRQTWGNASEELGVVFVMGRASNKEEEDIVANESLLYHDIVQGNSSDQYKCLTYKHLSALYWLTKNCKNIHWVIKADDDIMLDVKKYLYFIENHNSTSFSKKIFCEILCNNHVVRKNDRFAVSEKEYPYDHYPPYCLGNLWLTSIDVVQALLNAVPQVKYLWIDDIFVTGILAMKANIQRYRIKIPDSSFSAEQIGKIIAWGQIYSKRLDLWREIEKYYNPQYPSIFAEDLSG